MGRAHPTNPHGRVQVPPSKSHGTRKPGLLVAEGTGLSRFDGAKSDACGSGNHFVGVGRHDPKLDFGRDLVAEGELDRERPSSLSGPSIRTLSASMGKLSALSVVAICSAVTEP